MLHDSDPALSIVTISFNKARFLAECIESVLSQKRAGIDQYIVVDPGSTDGSRDIIDRYGDAIDVRVYGRDSGPADGLNRGFAHADRAVLGYLNADDRFVPGAFDFVRHFFRLAPAEVDVLTGAIRIIDAAGRPALRKRAPDAFNVRRWLAGVCMIGQQATFFRRAAFLRAGGFNPANRIMWDGELMLDMALTGARFARADKVLGDWRIYDDTITGGRGFRARLHAEFRRCAGKAAAHGVSPYAPLPARALAFAYKFSPARHLRYLLVR